MATSASFKASATRGRATRLPWRHLFAALVALGTLVIGSALLLTGHLPFLVPDGWEPLAAFLLGGLAFFTFCSLRGLFSRSSEEKFSLLFDHAADAYLLHDETGILDCNQIALDLLGCRDKREVLGRFVGDFSPAQQPDGQDSYTKSRALETSIRAGGIHRFEWVHQRFDGSLFTVEVTVTPICFRGKSAHLIIWHDITAHKESLRRLQESDERYELAVRGSQEGLWDWHLGSNRVYYSPRWKAMLGYADVEISDSPSEWETRVHPDDLPSTKQRLQEYLEGRSDQYSVEFRMRHRDGSYRWIFSRGEALRDAAGKPLRLAGSHTDITARKQIEGELQQAKEAAEAANQAKSTFLTHMSHELRTPLTAILGFAEALDSPSLSPERRTEQLRRIRRNGEHLLRIINDLLDISCIEMGRIDLTLSTCSPVQIVRDALAAVQFQAEQKGLSLSVVSRERLPRLIRTDSTRVQQILVNLLSNAVKFTPSGSVRVRLEMARGEGGSSWLSFAIEDDGPGIPPEQIEHIFEPFVQADSSMTRKHGGIGLGLSISRQLAHALGGDLHVVNRAGTGSCFTLRLPLTADDLLEVVTPTPPAAAATAAPVAAGSHQALVGRVLVAEDARDVQLLLRHHLEKAGLRVEIVGDGRQAVERALADDFDLVLMDMQMPELDGYGATRELRARGYRPPIVALTAHAMRGDREQCLAAGCTDYLTKPIPRDQLLQTVSRWLPPRAEPTSPVPSVRVSSGPQRIQQLRESYLQRLPGQLADLQAVVESGEWPTVARHAHRLAGTAGMYGFDELSETAQLLESAIREGQQTELLMELVAELTTQIEAATALPSSPVAPR